MRLSNTLPQAIQNWAQTSMGALSSGFAGLLSSSEQHHQASKDLMAGLMSDQHNYRNGSSSVGVTVEISDAYRQRAQELPDRNLLASAESSVASINEAGITYSASARLIKASSTMVDALFDAIA